MAARSALARSVGAALCVAGAAGGEARPLEMPDFSARPCEARSAVVPVNGSFVELPLQDGSAAAVWASNSTGNTGWDFLADDGSPSGCRHRLWARDTTTECLQGAWLMVIGASSANIWMVQLVDMLVPGTLLTKRDRFNMDGVWTQMIDIIIDGGKVVYKKVVVDEGRRETHDRVGVHSRERDQKVLRKKFQQVDDAPAYSPSAVRITHFVAEFWDDVGYALDVVRAQEEWSKAQAAVVLSIGLWYINSLNCQSWDTWCKTRPDYVDLSRKDIVQEFHNGMEAAVVEMRGFCAQGGRAGKRGCAVTSIDHCYWMQGKIWSDMYSTASSVMAKHGSDQLRFVDIWTLTSRLGLDCVGEHQSPISALWTWQILLSSFCDGHHADPAPVAVFKGDLCRKSKVDEQCKNYKEQGFKFDWECALAQPCELQAYSAKELVSQDYDACIDYMDVTGCGWTAQWNCRGQPDGSEGATEDDGSVGYRCCCTLGLWDSHRLEEAKASMPLPVSEVLVGLSLTPQGQAPRRVSGAIGHLPVLAGAFVVAAAAAAVWLGRACRRGTPQAAE